MTENRTVADDQFIDSDSLDERFKDIRALQKEVAELLYTKRSLLFFEKPGLTSIFYSSIFRHEKKLKLLSAKIEKYKFEIKQIQAVLNGQDKSLKDIVKQSKRHFVAVKNELKEWKKDLKKTIKTGGDFTFKLSKKKEKQLKNLYDWIKAEPVVTGFKEGYSRILLAPSSNYYYSKNLQGLKEITQYAYDCNLNWYKPIKTSAEMRQATSACQAARDKLKLQIDQIKRQFPFTRENELRYDDEKERCVKELREKTLKAHKDVLEWRQKRNEFVALYRLSKRKPLPGVFKKRAEITPRRTVNASVHLMKTNVAGTAYIPDVAALAEQLKPGDRLFLIREPNNKYDSNAIMVLNQKEQKLGYIPKAKNPLLAKMMDEGALLYANVDDVEQNDSWVKIAINVFLNY